MRLAGCASGAVESFPRAKALGMRLMLLTNSGHKSRRNDERCGYKHARCCKFGLMARKLHRERARVFVPRLAKRA